MNLIELDRALKQLRLGGMAAVLETRLRQAQSEPLAPIDLISCLVSDELARRGERLLERRKKQAQFRDAQKTLDNFDFNFNRKMNRSLASGVTLKPANGGQGKTGQRKWPGTKLFYPAASCEGKSVFVRQLRGPHLRTCPWWRRRSSMAVTAALSPNSLPQSSTGRLEVSKVLARS